MKHRCMCCDCKLKDDTPGPGTSHGLCIPCLREHYPEVAVEVEAEFDKEAATCHTESARTQGQQSHSEPSPRPGTLCSSKHRE